MSEPLLFAAQLRRPLHQLHHKMKKNVVREIASGKKLVASPHLCYETVENRTQNRQDRNSQLYSYLLSFHFYQKNFFQSWDSNPVVALMKFVFGNSILYLLLSKDCMMMGNLDPFGWHEHWQSDNINLG